MTECGENDDTLTKITNIKNEFFFCKKYFFPDTEMILEWDDLVYVNDLKTRSDLNNRCARVCEKGPAANGRIDIEMMLGCEKVRIGVDKLTLIADEDKLKEFSMSDAEKLDAGKFLHANKGSTRFKGLPGVRMMSTNPEWPASESGRYNTIVATDKESLKVGLREAFTKIKAMPGHDSSKPMTPEEWGTFVRHLQGQPSVVSKTTAVEEDDPNELFRSVTPAMHAEAAAEGVE